MTATQPIKLPGTSRAGAYLYLVEFNSGTIKVGRTRNPASRLKNHATTGRPHGISVSRQWLSQPHRHAEDNERLLLKFCHSRFTSVNEGEFFENADTGEIIAFLEQLPESHDDASRIRLTRYGRMGGKGGSWPEADPVIVLPLPEEIMTAVDAARGGMSRAAWVAEAVKQRLSSGN